jgi:RNA polymerase sigma factor (sigma-70 family)
MRRFKSLVIWWILVSKLGKDPFERKVERRSYDTEQGDDLVPDPGPAFEAYLVEMDEERADRLLVELVCEHAQPIAKKIVASKLRAKSSHHGATRALQDGEDVEDVCNDVLAQLLRRLRRLKASSQMATLTDFSAYVAVTAFNACNQFLRKKYPERYGLKNRLRYALGRDERLALWERTGRWICGLAEWRNEDRVVAAARRLLVFCQDSDLSRLTAAVFDGPPREIAGLIGIAFVQFQNPVDLEDLVDEFLESRGTTLPGHQRANLPSASFVDPIAGYADRVEQQLYLRRLWSEIQVLPPRQRAALLLNLRDEDGNELVTLLVHTRVATLTAVAEALQLSSEELANLWNKLPVEDATIAEQFGLSRQQVINLRVSARRRLARKMSLPPAGREIRD